MIYIQYAKYVSSVLFKKYIPPMTLNQYFDKIYCVNLDRRPDKWAEAVEEFKKNNMEVERFAAIDGQTLQMPPMCMYANPFRTKLPRDG